jgi:hypothetical protein
MIFPPAPAAVPEFIVRLPITEIPDPIVRPPPPMIYPGDPVPFEGVKSLVVSPRTRETSPRSIDVAVACPVAEVPTSIFINAKAASDGIVVALP